MSLAYLANTGWMFSCRSALKEFDRSTRDVAATQRAILTNVLSSNARSDFGRKHHFDSLRATAEFRSSVSLGTYQSHAPWIDRIAAGEHGVLTSDPVQLLQPTSGSSGARKLIPYTDSLRRQFQSGIDAWIANLFSKRPNLRKGRSYWSITPSMDDQRTEAGLKIGFDDDSQYLGWLGRIAARYALAVQSSMINGVRVEDTLRTTVLELLSARDMTLVSVWSPTYLLSLLRMLQEEKTWLLKNLRLDARNVSTCSVQRILESSASVGEKAKLLWPDLSLISCWTDGPSVGFAGRLRDLLPDVEIQPKGLISTEAFVSFPLVDHEPSALSVRSHFYEFIPLDDDTTDCTYLAHELDRDRQYRVVVTTGGGLYRYQTGDIISVEGFYNECPLIRFIGRGGSVSDLVGEKLSDDFVAQAINNTMQSLKLNPSFAYIVPINGEPPAYCMRVDLQEDRRIDSEILRKTMESELSKNPYYDHAVRVGQLRPLEVSLSDLSGPSHWELYQSKRLRDGVRRGDIKPISLDTQIDTQHR
ncbi:MAG: GH3 auxin-responsive promoter family protein [Planctomycetales bacterium]|nr:GH3 auxin-responsive promoter family protein [Planctomycetales bacterium]